MTEAKRTFFANVARSLLGAGALIIDAHGDVLIVEPTYKDHWEVPGGLVDASETAVAACARELREELGIDVAVGRLLVIEHQTDVGPKGNSVQLIYDGGVLADSGLIRLASEELRSFGFFSSEQLATRLSPKLTRRIRYALDALREGIVIELENGSRR